MRDKVNLIPEIRDRVHSPGHTSNGAEHKVDDLRGHLEAKLNHLEGSVNDIRGSL